ncbi:group II intron reverse transcriptase domain-containing protein [Candidatus Uhrbacteria bacterium]|nr:group II intron reverse transcriptase domain-containing protein [Candidatus Uhrbacteria bacterium]
MHQDLISGEYRHGTYQEFSINDPKPRLIHKASVRDRLLHHAIHRKLYPFFAVKFIADSFSCQRGKGLHRALRRFYLMARKAGKNHTVTCWVLKCDIRKFFASIDQAILLVILQRQVTDGRIVDLLSQVIRSFQTQPGKGLPLGNLTSQLLANIYLDVFDQFVKHDLRWGSYIRYADDFVFLSADVSSLERLLPRVRKFLAVRLSLQLHPSKVIIKTVASGVDFLGWVHFADHAVPRTKTRRRMLKRIRASPRDETIRSYLGMLRHGDAFGFSDRLKNEFWLHRSR